MTLDVEIWTEDAFYLNAEMRLSIDSINNAQHFYRLRHIIAASEVNQFEAERNKRGWADMISRSDCKIAAHPIALGC